MPRVYRRINGWKDGERNFHRRESVGEEKVDLEKLKGFVDAWSKKLLSVQERFDKALTDGKYAQSNPKLAYMVDDWHSLVANFVGGAHDAILARPTDKVAQELYIKIGKSLIAQTGDILKLMDSKYAEIAAELGDFPQSFPVFMVTTFPKLIPKLPDLPDFPNLPDWKPYAAGGIILLLLAAVLGRR